MANTSRDADAEQLRALGYTSNFDRTMSFWENFALGFTYLSPVVGVYSVFAMALRAAGPPMFWNYLLVGLGQFLRGDKGGVEPSARHPVAKKIRADDRRGPAPTRPGNTQSLGELSSESDGVGPISNATAG